MGWIKWQEELRESGCYSIGAGYMCVCESVFVAPPTVVNAMKMRKNANLCVVHRVVSLTLSLIE